MLSTVLMMPLVNFIGGEDKALGFQGGIAVLSVIAFLMLAFCFFTTKERVEAPPSSTSMREDLRDIWRNDQWRWLACSPSSISSRSAFAAAR
jgi:GPH family glycoside/pentoside/hexuronide:cation symporter